MAEVTANYANYQQFEPKDKSCQVEETEAVISDSQPENGECRLSDHMDMTELLKKGRMEYG